MTVNKTQNGDNTVITLEGRLDTATSPLLQDALLAEIDKGKAVELDFTKLAYVSSAGLRVLLMGGKAAKAKGTEQIISHVSPEIMEIFSMTGFDTILKIV